MTDDAPEAKRFLALVATAQEGDPALSSIQAAIMVAADLGIASDSRSFARILGVEHALAIRELNALAERGDVITIVKRDARTLRTFYKRLGIGS
ncbi:hypothetical protein [Neorhizobium sp. JUb45]|uniref:hypothetical protein n=1 Tax=unclassified Neorhizobium TaxID=2629175 RepID=UPI001053FEE1|nr:hypothetical protein [Neorhizobium sp. JUb45]TCR02627.1 formate dehydrogenase F4B subunit [Neorhizobium sp. JUb45]